MPVAVLVRTASGAARGVDAVDQAARGAVEGGGVGHACVDDRDPHTRARARPSGGAAELLGCQHTAPQALVVTSELHTVVRREPQHAPGTGKADHGRAVPADDRHVHGR